MLPSSDESLALPCKVKEAFDSLESLDLQLGSPPQVHIPNRLLSSSTSRIWKYQTLRSPNISHYDLASLPAGSQFSPLSPSHSQFASEPPSPVTPSTSYLESGSLLNSRDRSPTVSCSVLLPHSKVNGSLINSYYQVRRQFFVIETVLTDGGAIRSTLCNELW